MDVKAGSRIQVKSPTVGAQVRRGTVLEVLSRDPLELRVQWEDGHESNIYPVGGSIDVIAPDGN